MKRLRGSYRWAWLIFAVVALVGLPALVIRSLMVAGVIDTLTVTLETPAPGAVVYASTLTVTGRTEGFASAVWVEAVPLEPSATFTGYREAAPLVDGRFTLQFIPAYDGVPVPMAVRVYAVTDAERQTPKAEAEFTLASSAERPDGVYVDVLSPQTGDEAGGDLIRVEGRASGVPSGALVVELVDSNGQTLDSQTVTLRAANLLDDVPWQAALNPGEVAGSAIINVRGADGTPYQTVPVTLSAAAG